MADAHDTGGARPVARGSFTITARGPFSLESSIRFLEGFAPAAYEAESPGTLDFAFALEGSWQTVGVSLEQHGPEVRGHLYSARPLKRPELSAARAQVERILSLDVDGSAFSALGEHDRVVARLQERYPGLRPVCFWSWYEAAAWAVIGQRVRMEQAAATKARLAAELGETVVINGVEHHAFPAPAVLAGLGHRVGSGRFRGLTGPKIDWLSALGEAARRNVVDSARLRAMPREQALETLRAMPGIGPFSAELILLRGAGDPDHAPLHEGRLGPAVALAYGLDAVPDAAELAALSEGWAPYRTWVTLLLRANLAAEQAAGAGVPGAAS